VVAPLRRARRRRRLLQAAAAAAAATAAGEEGWRWIHGRRLQIQWRRGLRRRRRPCRAPRGLLLAERAHGQGGRERWELQRQRWHGSDAEHAALEALRHRAAQAQQNQRQVSGESECYLSSLISSRLLICRCICVKGSFVDL
jgi:hypothetical protein